MELYVIIDGVEKKLSLFGDEDIELTRSWGQDQMLNGYGSYSKTFSIPADSNNMEIFKYVNYLNSITYGDGFINPAYFITAKIVINDYELPGNLSFTSFSNKNNKPYSFDMNFYGEEKSLVKYLNVSDSELSKLNALKFKWSPLYDFTYNYNNVIDTWPIGNNLVYYVPLMACERPLVYRNFPDQINNIYVLDNYSGVTINDLRCFYNLYSIFDNIFDKYNLTLELSTEVSKFINNMYIKPNDNRKFLTNYLTHIYTFENTGSTTTITDFYGQQYIIAKFNITSSGSTELVDGIYDDNTDTISWNTSTNTWTCPVSGTYDFSINILSYDRSFHIYGGKAGTNVFDSFYISIYDSTYNLYKDVNGSFTSKKSPSGEILLFFNCKINLNIGDEVIIATTNSIYDRDPLYINLKASIYINLIEDTVNRIYDYKQLGIQCPDMLVSEFFINFCKTYNIFYIYNDVLKTVKLYFRNDFESTSYDLSQYLILDDKIKYSPTNIYKNVDYKYRIAKDLANTIYKKEIGNEFGQYKEIFNYDVGIDKKEYTSQFGIFPETYLNQTDDYNIILNSTDILLHTELDEKFSKIENNFILLYKNDLSGITNTYNLQNDLYTYAVMYYSSNYGTTNNYGYSLDFNQMKQDCVPVSKLKYDTTMEFILPNNILYNLKVYDRIIVNNIIYSIVDFTFNIKNGRTKIKLQTL